MKRSLALLCALLLLASCAPAQPGENAPPLRPEPPPPAAAAENAPAIAPPEDGGMYFALDRLPLLPEHTSGEKVEKRVYDGYQDALLPKKGGYGTLYSFTGRRVESNFEFARQNYFGLMTADGRVVVDPVYTSVFKDGEKGSEVLVLTRMGRKDPERSEVEIAALDGSWAVGPIEGFFIAYSEGRIVVSLHPAEPVYGGPVMPQMGGGTVLYDEEGKLLFAPGENFSYMDRFFEGLSVLQEGQGEEAAFSYIDREGKIVIPGPFASAQYFSGGLASVQDPVTRLWGVIDRSGSYVIEPAYAYIDSFSGGYAPFTKDGRLFGILDREGKIILPAEYESAYMVSGAKGLCSIINYSKNERFLFDLTKGERLDATDFLGDGYFSREREGGGVTVFRGEKSYDFPGALYAGELNDDYFYIRYRREEGKPSKVEVLNKKTGEVKKIPYELGWGPRDGSNVVLVYDEESRRSGLWDLEAGEIFVPAVYDVLNDLGDGLYERAQNGVWEVVDRAGNLLRRSALHPTD